MRKFRILNGHPGIGGNRYKWDALLIDLFGVDGYEIVAVEINPEIASDYQKRFPKDKVIVECVHEYLLKHFKEFDFIWLSPPCPTHSKMMKFTRHDVVKYPDMALYQEILLLQHFFKGKYIVENVQGYYTPLIEPEKIGRHYFWSNFKIGGIELPKVKDMSRALREDMVKYLGFDYEGNIYIGNNHCPVQVLRNCVHPLLGEHVLSRALGIITKQNTTQTELTL